MPRILDTLLAFPGLCYKVNSFASFLSPAFATRVVPIF
jgi:hypothetical protein